MTERNTVEGTSSSRVPVLGMTCRACESRVSKALLTVPGVSSASVSSRTGIATISTTGDVAPGLVEAAIRRAGYDVGTPPLVSRDRSVWLTTLVAALAVAAALTIAGALGLAEIAGSVGSPDSGALLVVFLVGLTAGVSTCMALVGGVVLAVSASRAVEPTATRAERLRPHLAFQVGRIAGFFVLGAVLGAVGARLAMPTVVQASLMLAVAAAMAVLGLRLTGLSPRAAGWSPTLPPALATRLGLDQRAARPYSGTRTALLGAATFFLPCGFTQAMQLYALSTGSPVLAGTIMAVFALGTAPGLLALAGLPALATGARRPIVLSVIGVVLVAFALVNATAAFRLLGWTSAQSGAVTATAVSSNVSVSGGVQTVTMTQGDHGYTPATTFVYAHLPIRWVVTSESGVACAAYLRAGTGWKYDLTTGVNTIDLPAMEPGTWDFTCVMGMYSGALTALDLVAPPTS